MENFQENNERKHDLDKNKGRGKNKRVNNGVNSFTNAHPTTTDPENIKWTPVLVHLPSSLERNAAVPTQEENARNGEKLKRNNLPKTGEKWDAYLKEY